MNTTKLMCFGMVGKLFAASVKIEGLIYDWVKLDSTIANACCFDANEFRATTGYQIMGIMCPMTLPVSLKPNTSTYLRDC
jgi:hypothetical protein